MPVTMEKLAKVQKPVHARAAVEGTRMDENSAFNPTTLSERSALGGKEFHGPEVKIC